MEAWFIVLYTIIALVLGFTVGRAWNRILLELWQLKEKSNHQAVEPPEPPKSIIVEPLSPEQQAARDMQDRIKLMNKQ